MVRTLIYSFYAVFKGPGMGIIRAVNSICGFWRFCTFVKQVAADEVEGVNGCVPVIGRVMVIRNESVRVFQRLIGGIIGVNTT
jgi:hypothetical protein